MVNAKDIEAFGEFAENVLKRAGYKNIICFTVQFASWWRSFHPCIDEVDAGDGETELPE